VGKKHGTAHNRTPRRAKEIGRAALRDGGNPAKKKKKKKTREAGQWADEKHHYNPGARSFNENEEN